MVHFATYRPFFLDPLRSLVFLYDAPYLSGGQTASLRMCPHKFLQDSFNFLKRRSSIPVLRSDAVHRQNLRSSFPFVSWSEVQWVGPVECTASGPTLGRSRPLPRSLSDCFTATGTMIGVSETLELALFRVVLVEIFLLATPLAFGFCLLAECYGGREVNHNQCQREAQHHCNASRIQTLRQLFFEQPSHLP